MSISHLRKAGLAAALLACCASASLFAQATFSSLEERMSYKEFKEYGLDKLSPEQLRGLNEWLHAHGTAGAVGVASVAGSPGAAADPFVEAKAEQQQIVSRLKGEFQGWHQGTVLTLENGQKWEVLSDDTVYAHGDMNPQVTIEKGGLIGGWRLTVEGHSDIAHVMPVTKH